METRTDRLTRWTAIFAVAVLFVALLIVGDYSGAVALVIGICLGVANAPVIAGFFGPNEDTSSPDFWA